MPATASSPFSAVADGVRTRLRVQPRARRNRVDGLVAEADGGVALKVAVTEAPEDGKANAAVIALLADELGVAKAAISVVNGAADRRKLVEIRGNSKVLGAALAALAGAER